MLSGVSPLPAPVDVLTYDNDNSRTGANPNEATLTPQNVNGGGKEIGHHFSVTSFSGEKRTDANLVRIPRQKDSFP